MHYTTALFISDTVPLFGLASSGVYPAINVAIDAVRSYQHLFTLTYINH